MTRQSTTRRWDDDGMMNCLDGNDDDEKEKEDENEKVVERLMCVCG